MGRIKDTQKYIYDTSITGDDYLIGSDFENDGKTKNFRVDDLAQYISEYFAAQNQTVTLVGDVVGGIGITIVDTTAQPSLIEDKEEATTFEATQKLLLVDLDGELKQIDAELIIQNSGGYTPPTYPPLILAGNGLEFVQTLTTNNLGHIIAASIGTIQDASTIQKGVIRIATPGEYNGGSTSIALPPAALSAFLPTSAINGTTNFIPKFTSSSSIGNSVIREASTNIGIDMTPVEKLAVNGYVLATGFKTDSNNPERVLSTDGGEVTAPSDVTITGGEINLVPYTDTVSSSTTIPSNRYQLVNITYDGTGVSDNITLPTSPIKGCRIYIYNEGTNPIIIQTSTTIIYELKPAAMSICHFNGTDWITTVAIDTI